MGRPRRATPAEVTELEGDQRLPGLDGLDQDPKPTRTRAPRKAAPVKTAGNRGRIPVRTAGGQIMSEAAMIAKVRAELYLWASAGVAIWDDRDECADVMFELVSVPGANGIVEQERLAAIVDQMVVMIARNRPTLEFLANTGIAGQAAVLVSLLVPVGKRLWRNHGPNGLHHRPVEEVEAENAARYPSYVAPVAA